VTAKPDDDTPGSPIDIDPMKTYVDKFAVLHIAEDMPTGAVVTVTATSAYINPSATTSKYTASHAVTITAPTTDATDPVKPTVKAKRTGKGASGTTDVHGTETATTAQ
jgi:hypothetical protein